MIFPMMPILTKYVYGELIDVPIGLVATNEIITFLRILNGGIWYEGKD